MATTVRESEKGFCTLEKDAAEQLRDTIKSNYSTRGGKRNLGASSIAIYKELAKHIDSCLASNGLVVKYRGKGAGALTKAEVAPTFLRHLFYNNPKDKKHVITGHLYSVDICYLYAFGQTHAEYGTQLSAPVKAVINGVESDRFTIVVVSVSASGNEAEKVRSRIESLLPGASVSIAYRDVAAHSRAAFVELYLTDGSSAILFWLIGKDYLHHEASVSELCKVQRQTPHLLRGRSVIILLEDVCHGDFSLGLTSGRLRLVQFWREQLEVVRALTGGTSAVGGADAKISSIVSGVDALVSYIGDEARSAPYDHFINRFRQGDVEQILDGMMPPQ